MKLLQQYGPKNTRGKLPMCEALTTTVSMLTLAFDTAMTAYTRRGAVSIGLRHILPQHKSNNNNLLITIMHWRRLNDRSRPITIIIIYYTIILYNNTSISSGDETDTSPVWNFISSLGTDSAVCIVLLNTLFTSIHFNY